MDISPLLLSPLSSSSCYSKNNNNFDFSFCDTDKNNSSNHDIDELLSPLPRIYSY